jgi:hypothetical protein
MKETVIERKDPLKGRSDSRLPIHVSRFTIAVFIVGLQTLAKALYYL